MEWALRSRPQPKKRSAGAHRLGEAGAEVQVPPHEGVAEEEED